MSIPLAEDSAFRYHHGRYLEPLQRDLEEHRRRSWRELVFRAAMSAVLLAAVVVIPLLGREPEDDFYWWLFAFIVLFTAVVLVFWCVMPWWTHKQRLKSEVLPRIVPFFGDFRYEPEPEAELSRYADWHVLPPHDKSGVEDEVTGHHAGVPLRALEVHLRRRRRSHQSGGSGGEETLFKGVLLELGLSRPAAGTTLIGTRNMFRGRLAIRPDTGLQRVPLEGSTLEAFAGDPDAVVRLDAALPAKLDTLIAELGVRGLRMSWHGDRVVTLIDLGRDLFELPQLRAVDFFRDAELVREQLSRLTRMVEILGLGPTPGGETGNPPPIDDRMQVKKPAERDALDAQKGCLWMVVFPVAGFCLYAWLLSGTVRPLAVLALAATAGVMAGVFFTKLAFHGGRAGTLLALALCLLGLAPTLPESTLRELPFGELVLKHRIPRPDETGARP